MLNNDERRTTEEAYVSASTTSNLKLGPADGPNRDADTIIAAGMSSSVVGACLIRLHGEWSKVEKPRFLAKEEAERLIAAAPKAAGQKQASAADRLTAHYTHETAIMLGKLKSFRQAHSYLTAHLTAWDSRPEAMLKQTALEVLIWWLDKQCKTCGGTKYEVAAGTNRHTNRPCRSCRGTGIAKLPRAEDGRRLANFIDDSCQDAKTSISRRLRNY